MSKKSLFIVKNPICISVPKVVVELSDEHSSLGNWTTVNKDNCPEN